MRTAAPILFLAATTAAASAQVATWYWTVSDTGNGDGVIQPGESALLLLSASFDPPQPNDGGFAGTDPYSILGAGGWASGVVDERVNLLDGHGIHDAGDLDTDNNILGIAHYQLPEFFQQGLMNKDNPIALFSIRWTPHDYAPRTVTLDNGGPDAYIYTDYWGNYLLYSGAGGSVTFHVVPAPASAAAFGLGALAALRRRR